MPAPKSTSKVRRAYPTMNRKTSPRLIIIGIFLIMTALIIVGIFGSALFAPSEENHRRKHNIYSRSSGSDMSLSQKILSWIPKAHLLGTSGSSSSSIMNEEDAPDWDSEFWTPIDLLPSVDPVVTLCKLNFEKYSNTPHTYAMFRDLQTMSNCKGSNKKKEKLSVLLADLLAKQGTPEGRYIDPTGFVFHESRVGSTLVANNLASDPFSLVFSESTPTANVLMHCGSTCTRQDQIQLFRSIVKLMGRSPFHKSLFFKFQSITSTQMEIALEAFPNTSWAYVFRQPVQTMMSHLDPDKGSIGSPCLRSMKDPPIAVRNTLKDILGDYHNVPKEAWCAAHLNMLCSSALDAYEKYKTRYDVNGKIIQRGLFINYESLPGIVPKVLLPMFGIIPSNEWVKKMNSESSFYSKGRGRKNKIFKEDSSDKEERSTHYIQQYSKSILEPSFLKLRSYALEGIKMILPEVSAEFNENLLNRPEADAWKTLSEFPYTSNSRTKYIKSRYVSFGSNSGTTANENDTNDESHSNGNSNSNSIINQQNNNKNFINGIPLNEYKHSVLKNIIPYEPWKPFGNMHTSKPFENIECLEYPSESYPNVYFMTDITNNWNTDNTELPKQHYDSLCHFNYQNETELSYAYNYRKAEVPFVVYNVPEVNEVAERWSNMDYLQNTLGKQKFRTENSKTNHFMYWMPPKSSYLRGSDGKKWTPPTTITSVTFEKWLENAIKGQNKTLENRNHAYFRVSGSDKNKDQWVVKELPFFKPKKSLFIVEPNEQRGIHCRFGMRSVIAEAHFDGSRNVIALLGGMRRYVIAHPNQCKYMHMYPKSHPSARHSAVDWSNPDTKTFPNFLKIKGNEIIMQPGDVLYLPTYWLHYIVSLNVNFQCNTRSGRTKQYDQDIHDCGF